MRKIIIINLVLFLATLIAVLIVQSMVGSLIGLSVESDQEVAKLRTEVFTLYVTSDSKEIEINNYPTYIIALAIVVNALLFWRSK